jgi:hypothetical protein
LLFRGVTGKSIWKEKGRERRFPRRNHKQAPEGFHPNQK